MMVSRSYETKARHLLTCDLYRFSEHGEWSDPDVTLTIERAIDCQQLFSFAVAGNIKEFVVVAFIMSIQPRWWMLFV
tara:strand:+ start:919 stop:1149 length:231 start_codon:yes stop_codon:yes gene_type:complete